MAKMTMLEMVQGILSDADSDEVNAIGDTTEAEQVAWVIEQTYRNLTGVEIIPEHQGLIQLESLNDVNRPVYLKIPENVDHVKWIKYDVRDALEVRTRHKDIEYLDPQDYLRRILGRDNSNTDTILVQDFSGVNLSIRNDREPSFWTSFDDEHAVFDAFDLTIEATIQESKTVSWGEYRPSFNRFDDSFIPDLDANLFPLLYAESKALFFDQFKQTQSPIVVGVAREQKTKKQNDKRRWGIETATPDYGRQPRVTRGATRRNRGKHRSQ